MASKTVPRKRAVELAAILDSPEIRHLVEDLEATRWTGRPGYSVRSLLGVALAKSLYAIPTWSRTVALVHEHEALQRALGGDCPSVYASYRFAVKLRTHGHLLEGCIERVLSRLRSERPEMGENIAIDASDLPAYANGQRYVSNGGRERELSEYSDPDASWGHRSAVSTRKGGGFYGYRIHAAVCTLTGLPLAWEVRTGKDNEIPVALPLLDRVLAHGRVRTVAMDKGYDVTSLYMGCHARGVDAIIPLKKTRYAVPEAKLRVPRNDAWKALYGCRGAVEREFGRLKHEWAMLPLRVRGLARVRLHIDLTILAKLCTAQFR